MSTGATGRDSYAAVLAAPHVRPLLVAASLARLPIGIISLALILFLRAETGSYATAGVVAAAFTLGNGVGGPFQGRAIDRLGQRRVILPSILCHDAALLALVALGISGAPAGVLVLFGLLAGIALPPLSSTIRTLWPSLLGGRGELVATAFALDAVLIELSFVTGPLLTAGLTALVSPQLALVLAVVCGLIGTLWFLSQPPSRDWRPREERSDHGIFGALRAPGLRTLIATVVFFGFCFGSMEVALPAFAEDHGSRAWSGVLLAAWSLASAAGGLAFGAIQPRSSRPLRSTFVRLAALLPLAYVPLALAPSMVVMALLVLPAGFCIAPLLSASNLLVGDVALPSMETEAYTWPITALVAGIAAGNTVAGAIVQSSGWREAFLAAAGGAAVGGVVAGVRRASLRPLVA